MKPARMFDLVTVLDNGGAWYVPISPLGVALVLAFALAVAF